MCLEAKLQYVRLMSEAWLKAVASTLGTKQPQMLWSLRVTFVSDLERKRATFSKMMLYANVSATLEIALQTPIFFKSVEEPCLASVQSIKLSG